MSTFELAIPTVLRHEGRFVDNPADPGGATNFGISLRWLVSQNLLSVLEQEEGDLTQDAVNAVKSMTQAEAEGFYQVKWWDAYGYGRIIDQSVATKIFDTAVNIGPRPAHRLAQQAVNSLGGSTIAIDGQLGSNSILALNDAAYPQILHAMQDLQAMYYQQLVNDHPNLAKFLPGWRNRAYDRI